MDVGSIMTSRVATVDAEGSVADAARAMRTEDTGWLPVTSDGKVLGVVTDRDIVVRAVTETDDPRSTKVRQVMSLDPVRCTPETSIDEAAETMAQKQIRRLLVADENDRLVGVVSMGDLATHASSNETVAAAVAQLCRDA